LSTKKLAAANIETLDSRTARLAYKAGNLDAEIITPRQLAALKNPSEAAPVSAASVNTQADTQSAEQSAQQPQGAPGNAASGF
jgi:hypothetical protein